jgi:chromosome segregation ATPase
MMKFVEPAFDPAGELWPALPNALDEEISALKSRIAKQSSELNFRLSEILELYNVQSRQTDALKIAGNEISRLKQAVLALQEKTERQRTDVAAAKHKIMCLENEKADLQSQLDQALQQSKTLADRIVAMQSASDAHEANVASALEQIEYLNSELATGAAERFRLVATMHSEKRRYNRETSIWENTARKIDIRAETRQQQIKHLETVRHELDKRVQILEALLKSEHEVAERKIKRLTEELQRQQAGVSGLAEPRSLPLAIGEVVG